MFGRNNGTQCWEGSLRPASRGALSRGALSHGGCPAPALRSALPSPHYNGLLSASLSLPILRLCVCHFFSLVS